MTAPNFGDSLPVLIGSGEHSEVFRRISLNDPAFDESRLQSLIESHPEVLPLADLDPFFSPAVCLGREIQTPSGRLDNLFISPSGGLTLVETKLWRNPEARRKVVAQIIDYAQQIAKWKYEDLESRVADYLEKSHNWSGSLYEWLASKFDDLDEETILRDRVSENLERGRLLLLIAGDGIKRNVQDMVSYLQGAPQLQFNLALVRLACYRHPANEQQLLLIPSIAAKTAEVERAVVRIEMNDAAKRVVSANVEVPTVAVAVTPGEEAFFDQLAHSIGSTSTEQTRQFVATLEEEPAVETAIQKRLLVKLFFESEGTQYGVWLFVLTPTGKICVGGHGKWKKQIIPREVVEGFWKDVGKSCPKLRPKISGETVSVPSIPIADMLPHADAIIEATRRYIAKIQECESES